MTQKRIIITGATSGLGYELAELCLQKNYLVGVTGRRTERFQDLKANYPEHVFPAFMDVSQAEDSVDKLRNLIEEMGGMDILVLNAGVSGNEDYKSWETLKRVIDVNVSGFVALANYAMNYFERQPEGQIVGISSMAGFFGYGRSPTYTASKAFVSNYMQGLRQRARRMECNLVITDIKPGFVATEMTANRTDMFWVIDSPTAARQMLRTIESRKSYGYVSRRWRLVAWLLSLLPNRLFDRI